jgi:large subunit ribosomal protein L9
MKVLLCEDIRSLGWLGDVLEVNEGYARNYLLPQGLAKVATKANIKAIAQQKAERAEQRVHERGRLEQAVKAVEDAEAVIAARANEQGVLFGSVTASQIAANLQAQGFEVADEIVQLHEHIKHIGTHTVTLKFTDDLTAQVKVTVVPEAEQSAPHPGDKQPEVDTT